MASPLIAIAKRQWRSYFNSPVAYVFIVLTLIITGILTWVLGGFYESRQADLEPFFRFIPWVFATLVPLLTMGLWSEERRTKTVEILLTLPVKASQAVIGKYIAAWSLLFVVIVLSTPIVFTTMKLGNPDLGKIICGFIGFWLLCGAFAAIGLFCSTLSRSPVVSFIIANVICVILVFLGLYGTTEFLYGFLPPTVVSAIASMSALTNFTEMQSGSISLFNVLYFVSLIVFFIAMAIINTRNPGESGLGFGGTLFGLLLAGVLIAVNIIAAQLGFRADLTADKQYTLSEGTKGVLKDLEKPVTLKYYFSRGAKDVPQELLSYGNRVQDLLKQYDRKGGKNVFLEVYNPKPFTEEEEWATKFGLTNARTMVPGNTIDPIFCGLVIQSGKTDEIIPFIVSPKLMESPNQAETIEYDITKAIAEVSRTKAAKVGVLSSLPVFGGMTMPPQNPFGGGPPPQPQRAEKWHFISLMQQIYDVTEIKAEATEIPEDITTLVAVHPKGLSEATLYAIDQFVMRGGNLVGFLDPYSIAETAGNQQMAMMGGGGSDLNGLTSAWGATFKGDKFIADPDNMSTTRYRNLGILDIGRESFAENIQAMRDIGTASIFFGGAFEVDKEKAEGVEIVELFTSSEAAGPLDSFRAMGDANAQSKELKAAGEKQPLAVRLTGTFPSAFPGNSSNATHVAEGQGSVVLMGDSDALSDQFGFMNFFGRFMPNPTIGLPMGFIGEATGSSALMSLQNRGNFNRRLDYVDDIEREASKETQEQRAGIQEGIEKANAELAALKPPEGVNPALFLNKELKAKQEQINADILEAEKQIRLAEEKSLKGVRSLGTKLKFLHIAIIPGIVALFGILRFVLRNFLGRPKRA